MGFLFGDLSVHVVKTEADILNEFISLTLFQDQTVVQLTHMDTLGVK